MSNVFSGFLDEMAHPFSNLSSESVENDRILSPTTPKEEFITFSEILKKTSSLTLTLISALTHYAGEYIQSLTNFHLYFCFGR